jgi:hypothetical protein
VSDELTESFQRPFGAASRADLLDRYFEGRTVRPTDAWRDVYRLLLWVDRTTGLAHCYESDKAQPGRPWYGRSLIFHAWLCDQFGVAPRALGEHVDWLFREAANRLALVASVQRDARAIAAAEQLRPFASRAMPEPGDDPVLRSILKKLLAGQPGDEAAIKSAAIELYAHFTAENRRKNLLGEGFEDVLAATVARLPGSPPTSLTRKYLHEIPGFREPPAAEKARRVDLALVAPSGKRTMVSAKWSVRADREEQFGIDFDTYVRLEASSADFDFALVTNEFDAARLVSACDRRSGGRRLFDHVVHVNPQAVLAVYDESGRGAAARLPELVSSGRLQSLGKWLSALTE